MNNESSTASYCLRPDQCHHSELIDAVSTAVVICDADGHLVDLNETALKILGFTDRASAQSRTWSDMSSNLPPSSMVEAKERMRKAITEGHQVFDWQTRDQDDELFWAEVTLQRRIIDGRICIVATFVDATPRLQADEALRNSERTWRTTFDTIGDGLAIIAADGKILKCNTAMEQIVGCPAAELIGRRCCEVVHHAHQPIENCPLVAACKSGRREVTEVPVGDRRYQVTVDPLFSPAGKLVSAVHIMSDITARVRAEAALRDREARLSGIFLAAPVGIGVATPETVRETNNTFSQITGYTSEELAGLPTRALYETIDEFEAVVDQCRRLAGHCVACIETRWRKKDGSVIHVMLAATLLNPLVPNQGATFIVLDITARKQAEARITRQAALLDAANDAIFLRTLDQKITYWNDAAERLFGWTRTETLGKELASLDPALGEILTIADATLLKAGSWSGELKLRNRTGQERTLFCRWTLLRDNQGRPTEVLAINTDVTEQKQLEASLLRAQRLESVGALAGGIAHDLNNILQPILMTVPLLTETAANQEVREAAGTVGVCAQRGADIIRQLLTFARGRPGTRLPLQLGQLLDDTEKIIRETFPRNIRPIMGASPNLWPVMGDPTQIHQAIMNLCLNARDAMPGGGTLTITAANWDVDSQMAIGSPVAKPGNHVRVCVTDTGTGMDAAILDRIFDPFFTTKAVGKGTGLGLASVLGIVRGHDGFVRVQSAVGKGSTFELFFPATPKAQAAEFPAPSALPPRAAGERILIVDDEPNVRRVLQRALERHGYQVLIAADGAEALTLMGRGQNEIQAVITDMMMPGMDGPTLVQSLRRLYPHLPIIGMTGLTDTSDNPPIPVPGLTELLAKPFHNSELLETLNRVLMTAVAI